MAIDEGEEGGGVRVSKIVVDRSPEVEKERQEKAEIQKELDEKKAIIANQALAEFEDLKQKLSEKFNDNDILSCVTPSELYSFIASMNTEKQPQKAAPHGKAPFIAPNDSTKYETMAELVDALYYDAYYNPDTQNRKTARAKIDTLFETLISSRSWEQLRRTKVFDAITKTNVESCPCCGKTLLNGESCPCGCDPYNKRHKPRTYQNPLVR